MAKKKATEQAPAIVRLVPPNPERGRASRESGSEAIKALWAASENLRPTEAGGEWVPVLAVQMVKSVMPRHELDEDAVKRYEETLEEVPPILVQQDTFVGIDFLHRYTAFARQGDFVRIREIDIPDSELFERATAENVRHGLSLTLEDRGRAADKLIVERPDLDNVKIAEICGLSRETVWRHRNKIEHPEPVEDTNGAGVEPHEGAGLAPRRKQKPYWLTRVEEIATEGYLAVKIDEVPDERLELVMDQTDRILYQLQEFRRGLQMRQNKLNQKTPVAEAIAETERATSIPSVLEYTSNLDDQTADPFDDDNPFGEEHYAEDDGEPAEDGEPAGVV